MVLVLEAWPGGSQGFGLLGGILFACGREAVKEGIVCVGTRRLVSPGPVLGYTCQELLTAYYGCPGPRGWKEA